MSFLQPDFPVFLKGPCEFLPERTVTNEELARLVDPDSGVRARAEWIEQTTGISERRWVGPEQSCSDLAIGAAREILAEYPGEARSLRHLILSTISGDYTSPPTSPFVQHALGLEGIGAFDISAACSGFVAALHASAALCAASRETQLLISADVRSKFLAPADLRTLSLFGDGASALLLSAAAEGAVFRFLASQVLVDGSVADAIAVPAGGSKMPAHHPDAAANGFIKMREGATLFVKATQGTVQNAQGFMRRLGLSPDEVDWLVPHQGNIHLVRAVSKGLGIPAEKTIETIRTHGNTSGSTVGIALHRLRKSGKLRAGHKVLLCSAGGGGITANALLSVC